MLVKKHTDVLQMVSSTKEEILEPWVGADCMGVCCGEGGGEEAGVGKVGLVGGTVTPLHYNGTLYETAHFGSRFLVRKVRYV